MTAGLSEDLQEICNACRIAVTLTLNKQEPPRNMTRAPDPLERTTSFSGQRNSVSGEGHMELVLPSEAPS